MHFEFPDALGSIARMVRARSKLTVEEVAGRARVDPQALRRLEGGGAHDLYTTLDRVVNVCGRRMTVLGAARVGRGRGSPPAATPPYHRVAAALRNGPGPKRPMAIRHVGHRPLRGARALRCCEGTAALDSCPR